MTLDAGTSLAVADTNKSFIENLSVDFSANGAGDGALVITNTTANGTFSAADLAAITLTGNEGNRYALVLADGNTTIRVLDTLAGEYVWNDGASEADWTAAGKWSKGGVAGDWFNSTHAAFANSGDKATLSNDVTAVDVTFRADAEVLAGGGTLTVPAVIVSNGVAATIAAPIAGPLTKDGAGTLTLATSRMTDETVLSEGTLAFFPARRRSTGRNLPSARIPRSPLRCAWSRTRQSRTVRHRGMLAMMRTSPRPSSRRVTT